jgi:hypothetical protein
LTPFTTPSSYTLPLPFYLPKFPSNCPAILFTKMLAVFIFGSNKCFGLVDTDQSGLEENTTGGWGRAGSTDNPTIQTNNSHSQNIPHRPT